MMPKVQRSYVLRVWLEPPLEQANWRASLANISSKEEQDKHYFSDLDSLIYFLKEALELWHSAP